jgi:hypothetical protein
MKLRKLGAAAALALAVSAAQAQVREATIVKAFPDIGMEDGVYTTCGVRVIFSDSQSAESMDMYDLTVAVSVAARSVKKDEKAIASIVRATERRGNMLKDPGLQHGDRVPPTDVAFAIAPLRDPIHIRDAIVKEGTVLAPVDETKARQAGDFGGPLLRQLANGEPVLVFWSVSPNDQRTFRVRTTPNEDIIDSLQSCLKGTLQLTG